MLYRPSVVLSLRRVHACVRIYTCTRVCRQSLPHVALLLPRNRPDTIEHNSIVLSRIPKAERTAVLFSFRCRLERAIQARANEHAWYAYRL